MTRARFFLATCFCAALANAQQAPPAAPPPTPAPARNAQSLRGRLIYKPSGPGVPSSRVDAGSRGDGGEVASLYVIAPEGAGLALDSAPTLFWFQTAPARLPFEVSVLKPNDPEPVLLLRSSEETAAGFHRLDLSAHGVRLEPGVTYQWVVALVRDPANRSRDIVSSGWVRHIRAAGPDPSGGSAAALAAGGFWYDAVTALLGQMDVHPNDPQLAADRAGLFEQVGLPPLPILPTMAGPKSR